MTKQISWLTRSQQDALDSKLFQYKFINRMIAIRKLELDTDRENFDNIGKVQTSNISNIPEQLVIRYSEDIVLQNLYLFRNTVEKCYKSLDTDLQLIFEKRWIEGSKTWSEIAVDTNYSNKYIYYKRSAILERFAELSGEFILRPSRFC